MSDRASSYKDLISVELGFCNKDDARENFELLDEIGRMLNAMRRTLMNKVHED